MKTFVTAEVEIQRSPSKSGFKTFLESSRKKTPEPESLFDEVADLQSALLIIKKYSV